MSVYLKWEEPKEFALKKHKENTRSVMMFTWKKVIAGLLFVGFFMLIWYLATILPQNDTTNSPPTFWVALSIAIGLLLFILVALPLIEAKSSPPTIRIRITKRGIWLLDNKMNRTWHFSDIADFHITKEQVGGLSINAIELKDFDGVTVNIGISPEINIDTLQALLSEQIYTARERIKRSLKGPILYWQMGLGIAMVALGLSALIILGIASFDMKDRKEDVTFIKDDLKDIKEQYASGNPTTLQEKAFGKVAAKAYFAIHYIIKLGVSQLRILIGSIAAGILLFGGNLILWARNRRIYHRMRRLEVMYLELQTSQNQTKS